MLNLHPQISCPAEQSFKYLSVLTERVLQEYRNMLKQIDRRTGGQGAPDYGVGIENEMLAAMIGTLSKSFARGRPIHGLNDNHVFFQIDFFDRLLGRPKFIAILRNPVDVGLSAWRHNLRLAGAEPELAEKHLAIIDNPKKSVEGYIEKSLPNYRAAVAGVLQYAADHPNVLPVSYERLVAAKASELEKILTFLEAPVTAEIIEKMLAGSSREVMAAASKVPAFFGVDLNDPHRATVSREFRRATLEAAISPRMKSLGYDVATLMLGY